MIRLFAILFVLASPAGAQDIAFDLRPTTQCLDRAKGTQAAHACIGEATEACIEATPGGSSTYGMNTCTDRELAFWDDMLNTQYARVRADARGVDGEQEETFNPPSVADALRDMQRAWITYRDAACAFDASLWFGGTGATTATYGCLLHMTGEQALLLRATQVVY